MKCAKCGFVSFDFMSECKKCGTNIGGTREALGFEATKPAIPFYLGPLLKDYVKPATTAELGFAENTVSSFDFGEESDSHNGGFKPEGQASSEPRETEDFSLLDLTDEELDLLIADSEVEKNGAGTAATHHPEPVLNAGFEQPPPREQEAAGPKPLLGATAAPAEPEGQNIHIELSDNDLETLLSELGSSSKKKDQKE